MLFLTSLNKSIEEYKSFLNLLKGSPNIYIKEKKSIKHIEDMINASKFACRAVIFCEIFVYLCFFNKFYRNKQALIKLGFLLIRVNIYWIVILKASQFYLRESIQKLKNRLTLENSFQI